jgi:hypothetical protein
MEGSANVVVRQNQSFYRSTIYLVTAHVIADSYAEGTSTGSLNGWAGLKTATGCFATTATSLEHMEGGVRTRVANARDCPQMPRLTYHQINI